MDIDAFAPAAELVRALRSREVRSEELLDFHLERVARLNPRINAVVTLAEGPAREAARAADAAAARGESLGPLHGLPMTVKDSFETAGVRTTCGDPALADHVPTEDALTVARLKAAGAVIFGKTNTPTQTLDGQTHNPVFGVTNNPWDTARTPGGSSGGSAAAVAAGLSPLELGSDIGGSIRIPSHCCGVFGHKPSWGIVPERGHIPGPPGSLRPRDINVNGPIARDAGDLELALGVLAGPDELAAAAWRLELPAARQRSLRDFRVAAWLDDPECPTERAMLAVFEAGLKALAGAGAKVDAEARPPFTLRQASRAFYPLVNAETGSGKPRPHAEWIAADETRHRYRRQWAAFFQRFDILLAPAMFTAAFAHIAGDAWQRTIPVDGVDRPYLQTVTWSGLAGASYLPATVMPVGLTAAGLPAGWQAIGPYLHDRTTIAFARLAAEELGGFRRPPGY